jgi:anhydro-N-acetylmuramic acid kinase
MSGTSLDGIDGVVVDFAVARGATGVHVLSHAKRAFPDDLRSRLAALNHAGDDELHRAALAANALAREYAALVETLRASVAVANRRVVAIGCHGQTVRHRPGEFDGIGYTIQLNAPALLAELTGIDVIADFRSRDVAAGGQGAPLAPAFHAAVFADAAEDRVALNLGGIANLSFLPRGGGTSKIIGFDSGPGNCLLDLWALRHLGQPRDEDGGWAAAGKPLAALLERLLQEPYFAAAPPKSTGRDLFNEAWLRGMLRGGEDPQAVQATLLELTARSVADAVSRHCRDARRLIVCGGGAKNGALMRRLASLAAPAALEASDRHGIDPQLVEATAFAWLAQRALLGEPGNLPSVTGAREARVLGAVYPA